MCFTHAWFHTIVPWSFGKCCFPDCPIQSFQFTHFTYNIQNHSGQCHSQSHQKVLECWDAVQPLLVSQFSFIWDVISSKDLSAKIISVVFFEWQSYFIHFWRKFLPNIKVWITTVCMSFSLVKTKFWKKQKEFVQFPLRQWHKAFPEHGAQASARGHGAVHPLQFTTIQPHVPGGGAW